MPGLSREPESCLLPSWLFRRALGLIYLVAFASFGWQAAGLIGSRGILPLAEYLQSARDYLGPSCYWRLPTLFWLNPSDAVIRADWLLGCVLAALMMFGVEWRVVRIALFALYLSFATAGQVFMGYQWDALLIEAGFLAIFLGRSKTVVWLFRWLLFRLMFLSGAVKLLSKDPAWRGLTALEFHYQTQPIPTPLAWYAHHLPSWFQQLSVVGTFVVELAIPVLVFAPRRLRVFAAAALAGFQMLILLTGNYAFFNLLAIAMCLFLLDDALLSRVLPKRLIEHVSRPAGEVSLPRARTAVVSALAAFVLLVSGAEMLEMFTGWQPAPVTAMIQSVAPFELVNRYGLFAVMTTTRPEIVIEGSNDGVTWLPYGFKYKAGDLARRPRWIAPFQPRLDWQMWFAALGDYRSDPWVLQFMARLLEGSPEVLGLLEKNPFPDAPPHYVRAELHEYRFTTAAERKQTGQWWHLELKGQYVPAISLRRQKAPTK